MGSDSPPSFSKRLSLLFKSTFHRTSSSTNKHEGRAPADPKALKADIIKDLLSQSRRIPADLHLLMQLIDMKAAGGYEDDSLYVVRFRHKTADSLA